MRHSLEISMRKLLDISDICGYGIWLVVLSHLKNPENNFSSTGIIPDDDLRRFREPLASAYGRHCSTFWGPKMRCRWTIGISNNGLCGMGLEKMSALSQLLRINELNELSEGQNLRYLAEWNWVHLFGMNMKFQIPTLNVYIFEFFFDLLRPPGGSGSSGLVSGNHLEPWRNGNKWNTFTL